jgi:hypothetical protein
VTVLEVRTAERTRAKKTILDLTLELSATDASLAQANAAQGSTERTLGEKQRGEAELRRKIAAAEMAADIHQLEIDLEENLLAQRPLQATLAAVQDELAISERQRQRVETALSRARTLLAEADVALAIAEQDADQAHRWSDALLGKNLSDMVAEAKSKAVTDQSNAMVARLGKLLGSPKLVELLNKRLDEATATADEGEEALDHAIEASDSLHGKLSPLDGALLSASTAFTRAREAARTTVDLGPGRLAEARRALQQVLDAPELTAFQKVRIDERAAAALKSQGGAPSPVDKEVSLHDAAIALLKAKREFDHAALLKEVDDASFNRDDPAVLIAERKARDDARTAMTQAEQKFTAADKVAIDRWEVAIPPSTMRMAVEALRAVATISELGGTTLTGNGSLLKTLDDTETAYATALRDQLSSRAREGIYTARVAKLSDVLAALAPAADRRLVASVRGDA